MLTFSTFAAFPDSLDSNDFSISTASGGNLTANTYYFWIQLHNWAGRNTQTSLGSVTVTNGQKIVITLKPTLRRNGEDFNFVIISALALNEPSASIQITRWENKEEEIHPNNNKIALATDTYVNFSTNKTIEITENSQLTFSLPSLTVATFASLPTTNILNGAVRYVTADAKYYRYKANTNQWVEQLDYGLFPYIADSKLEGGCNRKLNILSQVVSSKLKVNQDSIYQRFWFINGYSDDGNGEIKTTNNVSLTISVNGELTDSQNNNYASMFSSLIKTRLIGYYDFSDRTLNTALTGVGETKTWTWQNSSLKLPSDLPRGQAAVYEIYYSFSTADLINVIPQGSSLSLNIYNYGIKPQPTDLSYLTGDFIVNSDDKLRLVPDTVGVKRLSGVSIIKNFSSNFTSEENYSLGILPDTDDQVAAISAAKVNEIRFIESDLDLQSTEVVRAFVGTVNGESALSNASNSLTVSANARINISINLPSDGTNATIRTNYPDQAIAGNDQAILNAPKLTLYLSNGSTVYKHENIVNCGNVDSLSFSISTLGTEVFTLPSPPDNDYCLFDFPNNPVISESVGTGSIPSGTYQVYLVYSYPSPNVFPTRIRHDLVGCISESSNNLIDYLSNIVEDTTPQLGGQLDVNGHGIGDGINELLTFTEVANAVNNINIKNNSTGNYPEISVIGDDTDVSMDISAKGNGNIGFLSPVYFLSSPASFECQIDFNSNKFNGIWYGIKLNGQQTPTYKNRYYLNQAIEIPAQGCISIEYPTNTFMVELTMAFHLQLAGQNNRSIHLQDVYCFSIPGRVINGNSLAVIASSGVWYANNITTASWSGTAISSVASQFFLDIPDTLHFMVCNNGLGTVLGHVITNSYSASMFAYIKANCFTI